MEGAALFRDEAPKSAILLDDVMRTDLGLGIAQPLDCLGGALHAGVVQNQHVDGPDIRRFAAAAVVRRRTLANLWERHAADGRSKKWPRLTPAAVKRRILRYSTTVRGRCRRAPACMRRRVHTG